MNELPLRNLIQTGKLRKLEGPFLPTFFQTPPAMDGILLILNKSIEVVVDLAFATAVVDRKAECQYLV